jgi:DNA-binding NtrC family response regulator
MITIPHKTSLSGSLLAHFGLCFALPKSTAEALALIDANPGTFAVVISDFDRPTDPKMGYGLLDEMNSRQIPIPFIFYASKFTNEQAAQARARGARNEVRGAIDLLTEVTKALPPEATSPGRLEFVMQKLVGCRGMWRSG